MNDPSTDLQRFVDAQSPVIDRVLRELAAGRKTTHWMWFVFPQLQGLGRSEMAHRFGIRSRDEAAAYLRHAILGARLRRNASDSPWRCLSRSAHAIFGSPDDLKFHSCLTLFDAVDPGDTVFREALTRFFEGRPDPATLSRLH